MDVTRQEVLDFEGFWNYPSKCRVTIWESDSDCVVLFTELPDNPGTSVTNASEMLANIIYPSLPNKNIRWFENYVNINDIDEIIYKGKPGEFVSPNWSPCLDFEELISDCVV